MVKNLFIGQKVRILFSNNFPELAGEQGRIISHCEGGGRFHAGNWIVAPDIWGCDAKPGIEPSPNYPHRFAPHSDQLEPILPEGAKPSEFSFTELMDNLGVVVA